MEPTNGQALARRRDRLEALVGPDECARLGETDRTVAEKLLEGRLPATVAEELGLPVERVRASMANGAVGAAAAAADVAFGVPWTRARVIREMERVLADARPGSAAALAAVKFIADLSGVSGAADDAADDSGLSEMGAAQLRRIAKGRPR